MPNDPNISHEAADADGVVTVVLHGELDLDRADEVRDRLAVAAATPGCLFLRIDAAGLEFIDSYGLGALVSARNTAAARGVTFTLEHPSAPVRKSVEVTGLGDIFGI